MLTRSHYFVPFKLAEGHSEKQITGMWNKVNYDGLRNYAESEQLCTACVRV